MRLIDADALKYKNLAEVNGRLTYVLTPEEINNAPTVEERPHGKWQEYEDTIYTGGGYTKCSNCGMRYSWGSYHEVFEFAYCPTCGAEMEVSNDG